MASTEAPPQERSQEDVARPEQTPESGNGPNTRRTVNTTANRKALTSSIPNGETPCPRLPLVLFRPRRVFAPIDHVTLTSRHQQEIARQDRAESKHTS